MKAEKFEDLEVWKKAHKLVLEIYNVTRAKNEVISGEVIVISELK